MFARAITFFRRWFPLVQLRHMAPVAKLCFFGNIVGRTAYQMELEVDAVGLFTFRTKKVGHLLVAFLVKVKHELPNRQSHNSNFVNNSYSVQQPSI